MIHLECDTVYIKKSLTEAPKSKYLSIYRNQRTGAIKIWRCCSRYCLCPYRVGIWGNFKRVWQADKGITWIIGFTHEGETQTKKRKKGWSYKKIWCQSLFCRERRKKSIYSLIITWRKHETNKQHKYKEFWGKTWQSN